MAHAHSHEVPAIAAPLEANANAQQQALRLSQDQPYRELESMSTYLPVEQKPHLPPNMRQWTRWEYFSEFLGYWKYGLITKIMGWTLLVVGIVMLSAFAPGGLLAIMAAARLIDLSWWHNFIFFQFGHNRTLVLVD